MTEHDKYKTLYFLAENHQPKAIAELLDVSYSGVLKLKRDYDAAKVAGTVKELLNYPDAVLTEIMAIAAEMAPVEIEGELIDLKEAVTGAKLLEQETQRTATYMVQKIRSMASTVESTAEFCDLAEGLCKLQTAFFNSNTTQVNIQQNASTGESKVKYGAFLDDRPTNN